MYAQLFLAVPQSYRTPGDSCVFEGDPSACPCPLQKPYKVPGCPAQKDQRTEEEKAKHMDRKTSTERARLLQEVFEAVEVRAYGVRRRAAG